MSLLERVEKWWSSDIWYRRGIAGGLKLVVEFAIAVAVVGLFRGSLFLYNQVTTGLPISPEIPTNVIQALTVAVVFSAVFCNFIRER